MKHETLKKMKNHICQLIDGHFDEVWQDLEECILSSEAISVEKPIAIKGQIKYTNDMYCVAAQIDYSHTIKKKDSTAEELIDPNQPDMFEDFDSEE